MKKIIALLCVIVLICSFAANTFVHAEEYVDLDENYYDKESYHNEIRKRYKELWGHLSSVAFTEEYYSFVKLLNETHDDAFTEFGTNLAGEKLDKMTLSQNSAQT